MAQMRSLCLNMIERSTAKNHCAVSILSVVSKVFEKLVNNRIAEHLEKCGVFSDFKYGFRSSQSTADLLTVVSDRIARTFNRSWPIRAVALDIYKALGRIWHAGLLHKLTFYGISGQIFGHISSFGFWIGNCFKKIQLTLEFLKGPFFVLHFSYNTLMTFLVMLSVILLSMLMLLLSTLNVIRHLICVNNNWLMNLNLIFETLGWCRE